MASPFPGMDPYLEVGTVWQTFHHHLTTSIYQALLPGLVDRYRARIGERRYVAEQALFTSIVREEHSEEYIEIRQRGETKVITRIEIVSPANRTTAMGRQIYLAQRSEAQASGSNLVEIDLVFQGQRLNQLDNDPSADWDYAVVVTRAMQPDRPEIWTTSLQKRLPRFRLPLAKDDRDTLVDLQAAFARAYDQGNLGAQIDYARDLSSSLRPEDFHWVEEILKKRQLR